MAADRVTLYYAPQTRSVATRILLDELGADYDLKVLNVRAGEQRQPAYLAINPMGKVPAIMHGDALVTEQAAIFIYLADLYPKAGLAPPIGSPLRGPYLRWLVYYGNCFEPALMDKARNVPAGSPSQNPYGDYDTMLGTLTAQLRHGPYLLGEQFSAADILWGTALAWTTMFKLVPELPEIMSYIARINQRPSVQKIRAEDAKYAAEHEAAVKK